MITLPATLRVVPLNTVVLFPGTFAHLRVSESRYHAMFADALRGDKTIGAVLIRHGETSGRAPLHDIGCAGTISDHHVLPEGRSLVVLHGIGRFRIRRETVTDLPYRVVETQTLYEAPALAHRMRPLRDEIRSCVQDYVGLPGSTPMPALSGLFRKLDLEGVVNHLCVSLPLLAPERQSLLECPTIERRCRLLVELLAFRIAEVKLGLSLNRKTDA